MLVKRIIMQHLPLFFQQIIRDRRGALSLTELMVSASIIGMLASVGTTQLNEAVAAARDAQRAGNIRQVETALALYYDDAQTYPVADNAGDEATTAGWLTLQAALEAEHPYPTMPAVPFDPLNTDGYQFKYWSDGQRFKITYATEDPNDDEVITRWGL